MLLWLRAPAPGNVDDCRVERSELWNCRIGGVALLGYEGLVLCYNFGYLVRVQSLVGLQGLWGLGVSLRYGV